MAAKIKTSITLSQDALDELEALSANDTHRYSGSSVVEVLIHQAYAAAVQPQKPAKRIEPVYEMIGKRKKLIGFDAWYGDHLVDTRDTRAAAQQALDAFVFEELSK